MNITYTGIRGNASWSKKKQVRLATLCYDEENSRDCQMAEYVADALQQKGYNVPDVNVSGSFEIVIADKEKYLQLVEDYKAAKKEAAFEVKLHPKKSRLYICYN